jgi:hypothetical protein
MVQLGKGIADDLKARAPWYLSDLKEGFGSGYRYGSASSFVLLDVKCSEGFCLRGAGDRVVGVFARWALSRRGCNCAVRVRR